MSECGVGQKASGHANSTASASFDPDLIPARPSQGPLRPFLAYVPPTPRALSALLVRFPLFCIGGPSESILGVDLPSSIAGYSSHDFSFAFAFDVWLLGSRTDLRLIVCPFWL